MTSAFIKTFGENPFVKVMDFLLENYIFDYSKSEVARETKVSRITLEPIWQNMIKQKIIIKTKKVGNAILYRLNIKNPVVIKLRELDITLINNFYEKEKIPIGIPTQL